MAGKGDIKLGNLAKYIVTAPSWRRSMGTIIILGIGLEILFRILGEIDGHPLKYFGVAGYILPALIAFVLSKPLVDIFGETLTWDWSALLALGCTVVTVLMSVTTVLIYPGLFTLAFCVSLGIGVSIRLLALLAIGDARLSRVILAGMTQPVAGGIAGTWFFGSYFALYAALILIFFSGAVVLFIWIVERPLKENFNISLFAFAHAFMSHLTDGSRHLEDFFREIGESVYVPQVSLFFRREEKEEIIFTVPNVHPGPLGEIGGGNLPKVLHDGLGESTLVAHGAATHDFNLVSESETEKIISVIRDAREDLSFGPTAGRSLRCEYGSVKVLAQRFGESVLMVSTRSPGITEDLDYAIGLAVMEGGHRHFRNVAFVDAHNCITELAIPVMPASYTAFEYLHACESAVDACSEEPESPFCVGVSHVNVPFSIEMGFGELGIQAIAVDVGGQTTVYILIDGNNMQMGVRDELRECIISCEGIDDCEVMTTDTHIVNMTTGMNPVGLKVTLEEIYPYIEDAVRRARRDCSPALVAGTTSWCKDIVIFGSQRISQLASSVSSLMVFIIPLAVVIVVLTFILTLIAFMLLV